MLELRRALRVAPQVVRLDDQWSLQIRPWFFKSASADTWNKEIYQAAVRYDRQGPVSLRVDAGYIASPIGLGMLDMRADINPTIQGHPSYFVPLMPFDRGAPLVRSIASSYPLGALATMNFFAPPNAVYKPEPGKDDPDLVAAWNDMNNKPTEAERAKGLGDNLIFETIRPPLPGP